MPAACQKGMDDIAEQLLLRWERLGPTARIGVPDNTTRLTRDTIALGSFSCRFNSLYRDEMHPFIGAMFRALAKAQDRARRLPVQNKVMLRSADVVELVKQCAIVYVCGDDKHMGPQVRDTCGRI